MRTRAPSSTSACSSARRTSAERAPAPGACTGGSRSTACTSGSATTTTPSGSSGRSTTSSTAPSTDPDCPLLTWRDAFAPADLVGVEDRGGGSWSHWVATFGRNGAEPGTRSDAGRQLSAATFVRRGLALLLDFSSSIGRRGRSPGVTLSGSAEPPSASGPAALGDLAEILRRAEIAALVGAMESIRLLAGGDSARRLAGGARARLPRPDARRPRRPAAPRRRRTPLGRARRHRDQRDAGHDPRRPAHRRERLRGDRRAGLPRLARAARRASRDARLRADTRHVRPRLRLRGRRPGAAALPRGARPVPGGQVLLRVQRLDLLAHAGGHGRRGVRPALPGAARPRGALRARPSRRAARAERRSLARRPCRAHRASRSRAIRSCA